MRLQDAMDAVDRRIRAAAGGGETDGIAVTSDEVLPLFAGTDVNGRELVAQIHTDTSDVLARAALGTPVFSAVSGQLVSTFLLGWEMGRASAEAEA